MFRIAGKILKFVVPVVVILVGVQATMMLIDRKKSPQSRRAPKENIKTVRVASYKSMNHQVVVRAQATASPVAELAVASQVQGKVTWVSPAFVEGGRVKKGDLLFRIDPVDHQLQVQQAQAGLAKATYELDLISAQKKAAESGINLYKKMSKSNNLSEIKPDMSGLARYEPQIANAKASLKSARASLKRAVLNFNRTKITAPFNGYIRSVSLAQGQIISSGQTMARMFKENPVILKVSLPVAELQWITIQDSSSQQGRSGSQVVISKQIGGVRHEWQGEVKRQLREIDALGRLVTVIVEVEQPISGKGFTLPLGMLVDVEIKGKTLKNVIGIPQDVLRKDSTVWVMSGEHRLEIRGVTAIRKNEKTVFISKGLNNQDEIVVTQIPSAVQGMKLRNAGDWVAAEGIADRSGKRKSDQKTRNIK